jgi:hypothetical protein
MQSARTASPEKLARIAIMSLDFTPMLKLPQNTNGTLDVLDLGQMYADTYGVHNIELQHAHLLSTEDAFLKDMRARYERTQSRITNINLEFGAMNVSAEDPILRTQAIDLTRRWVDHAVLLGSPRVMINQGPLSYDNKHYAVPALKLMSDYGKSKGVRVGVETRGNANGAAGRGGRGTAGAPGAAPAATPAGAPAAQPQASAPAQPTAPSQPVPGAEGARGAGGGGRGLAPAGPPPLTVIPAWVLLSEVIHDSGSYANVDMGNVAAQEPGELYAALRTLIPMTTGNTHTRVSPYWDLASVVKFMTQNLGYTGLFSIEANGGHPAVTNIYNIVLDAL